MVWHTPIPLAVQVEFYMYDVMMRMRDTICEHTRILATP